MDILLQSQQYLARVYRLYQVVGNLGTNSLLHDILLLAFCNHDNGCGRLYLLYVHEGLKSGHARHVLIKENEVECLFLACFNGIDSVGDLAHLVSLAFQEHYVGVEEFYLIVGPK